MSCDAQVLTHDDEPQVLLVMGRRFRPASIDEAAAFARAIDAAVRQARWVAIQRRMERHQIILPLEACA